MSNKETLYIRVLDVLQNNKKARECNLNTVEATYRTYKMSRADKQILSQAFDVIRRYNLPTPESIARERRYVVAQNDELRGTIEAQNARQKKFNECLTRARLEK